MNEIKDKTKRPGGEQWALFVARTTVGGHLELPSGGYEEESRTIAERDKIRQSMHRRTAPADYERLVLSWRARRQARRCAGYGAFSRRPTGLTRAVGGAVTT